MSLLSWARALVKSAGKKQIRPWRRASLHLEQLENRLVPYSISGNAWPHPELITISFVPDGTPLTASDGGTVYSNLQSTFTSWFGSAAAWQNQILKAAQVWAQQTNINFSVVPDSGASAGSGSYQQGDPTFGDIRIGGYNFGTSTLAAAFMPPPVNNYSIAGDFNLNTGQTFNIGSTFDLFTVAAHEFGHALGLNHGAIGSMMSSSYPGTMSALTTDDINGIRAIYSANAPRANDVYDAANPPNNTFATAADITSTIDPNTKLALINNLDLTTSTENAWYKFTCPPGSNGQLKVTITSTGLSLLDPKVTIYNASGKLLASANGGTYGATIKATGNGSGAGNVMYVKVYSADALAPFKTGKYSMAIDLTAGTTQTVPLPNTQTPNGTPLSSGGGVAVLDGAETAVNPGSPFGSGATDTLTVNEGGTPTTINVGAPKVAMDASGNYVVVQVSDGQDGSGEGIFAQYYNSSGVAQGSAFQVNDTTVNDQCAPAVAMQGNGNFVITWQSYGQDAKNTWGIYAKVYPNPSTDMINGSEFQVDTTTQGDKITPSVSYLSDGSFVITWASYNQDAPNTWGIYAQHFDATGVPQGNEFLVNTTTVGDRVGPVVTADARGNFIIAWSGYNQAMDIPSWNVYAQRFLNDGTPNGGETLINQTTLGDHRLASAAMTPKGGWIVTWTSNLLGIGLGVYARTYNSLGNPLSGDFLVNTTTTGDQTNPTVTTDSSGNFYIAWQSYNQDAPGTWGIYGQQFSAAGATINREFQVNSTSAGDQVNPTTAMDSAGHLVVVWNGNGVGSSNGVFMQRYSVNTSADSPPDGDAWELEEALAAPPAPASSGLEGQELAGHPLETAPPAIMFLGADLGAWLTGAVAGSFTTTGSDGVAPRPTMADQDRGTEAAATILPTLSGISPTPLQGDKVKRGSADLPTTNRSADSPPEGDPRDLEEAPADAPPALASSGLEGQELAGHPLETAPPAIMFLGADLGAWLTGAVAGSFTTTGSDGVAPRPLQVHDGKQGSAHRPTTVSGESEAGRVEFECLEGPQSTDALELCFIALLIGTESGEGRSGARTQPTKRIRGDCEDCSRWSRWPFRP